MFGVKQKNSQATQISRIAKYTHALLLMTSNQNSPSSIDAESIPTASDRASFSSWDRLRTSLRDANRPIENTPSSCPTKQSDNNNNNNNESSSNTHDERYTLNPDDESSEHYPEHQRPSGQYCKYPKTLKNDTKFKHKQSTYNNYNNDRVRIWLNDQQVGLNEESQSLPIVEQSDLALSSNYTRNSANTTNYTPNKKKKSIFQKLKSKFKKKQNGEQELEVYTI